MQDGWIKLYRSIQDKSYYRNSKILHLWIHLLLEATHKEMEVSFGGKPVTLKPGQILTGRDELARKTGIHQASIERVLNRLQIEQQIEQQTSTKNRIISIVNWEKHQKPEQQIERKPNNNRTTTEHIQEVKEVKEVKKKAKTYLPENFNISDRVRRWAKENSHSDLEKHLEYFKGKALSKGYQYIDWDEAFMGAVRDNWAKLPVKAKTYTEMTEEERRADYERRRKEAASGWA